MGLEALSALDIAKLAQVVTLCRESGVAAVAIGDIRLAFELRQAAAVVSSSLPAAAAPLTDEELLFLHERVGA